MRMLSVVIPFYNEESCVEVFFERLEKACGALENFEVEVVAVDDGSRDATLKHLLEAAGRYGNVRVVELSRNFGKECALTAGLDRVRGSVVVCLDGDLQHPPEVIPEMLRLWRKDGVDVVLARRGDRASDSRMRRGVTNLFYRLHNRISEIEIPVDVGDFRLMDRSVVDALHALPENRRFMKGLFAWVGFKTATLEYAPEERHGGHSSFNLWKLWNFALEGITSFSTVPLRIWTYLGATVAALAFVYGTGAIVKTLMYGKDVPGYASLLVAILFLGGIQLVGIGIIGEYLGRVYNEAKRRPVYVVRKEYPQDE